MFIKRWAVLHVGVSARAGKPLELGFSSEIPWILQNHLFFWLQTTHNLSVFEISLIEKVWCIFFIVFTASCSGLPHRGGINQDKCRCLKCLDSPPSWWGEMNTSGPWFIWVHLWCPLDTDCLGRLAGLLQLTSGCLKWGEMNLSLASRCVATGHTQITPTLWFYGAFLSFSSYVFWWNFLIYISYLIFTWKPPWKSSSLGFFFFSLFVFKLHFANIRIEAKCVFPASPLLLLPPEEMRWIFSAFYRFVKNAIFPVTMDILKCCVSGCAGWSHAKSLEEPLSNLHMQTEGETCMLC